MKKFLALIFLIFLLLRAFPYLNNPVPLGYDAGIYLYEFLFFPNLPVWIKADGFPPGLFAVFYPIIKLGISPESLIIPISILSQIALFFGVYFVSKKIFNEKIALLNTFLFSVSLIQFRTFWFYYVNNIFGLTFFLLAFYFLTKKNFLRSVLFAAILSYFHLPTFLIYCLTLIVLFIFDRKNLAFNLKVFISTMIIFSIYYLSVFDITILRFLIPVLKSIAPYKLITTGTISSGGGTFYSLPISFLMTFFYLPFGILGAYLLIPLRRHASRDFRTEEKVKPYLIAFILLFLMTVTGFFFSRRYFIPFDLLLIFFSGFGLNFVLGKYKNYKDVFSFYFLVLIIFIFAFVLKTGQPLITKDVFNEIKNFKETKGYVLSTSKEDSAWLLGYTLRFNSGQARLKLIAWSFGGEDKYWDNKQWQSFYGNDTGSLKITLLNKLPKPLYVFINDKQIVPLKNVIGDPCVKKLSPHFYKYICKE